MKLKNSYSKILYTSIIFTTALLSYFFIAKIYYEQKQVATQKAIQACDRGYGLDPVEPPSKTETHLGLDKTLYLGSDPHVITRLAWIVEMKGKWILVAGPPPDPNDSGPFYVDWCQIEIDVFTGKVLSEPIE